MGDCHARRLPSVHEAQLLEAEKDSVKTEGWDEPAGCIDWQPLRQIYAQYSETTMCSLLLLTHTHGNLVTKP